MENINIEKEKTCQEASPLNYKEYLDKEFERLAKMNDENIHPEQIRKNIEMMCYILIVLKSNHAVHYCKM